MLRELIFQLVETAAASSAAMVLVLLLRRPVRGLLGAGTAYALWALVPVALVAVLLPAPTRPAVLVPLAAQVGAMQAVPAPAQGASLHWPALAVVCWFVGVLFVAGLQLWQQRRFLRRLGPLRVRAHGLRVAATSVGLPAVTGVLRPRIVLPADFLHRYDAGERALVVAHERQHIAGGDLPCNVAVALLRCVYWFNPLLHLAVKHYRHDQELACDARVLQRHPRARRAYAQAMLKTQLDDFALPVGCHWHTHPIKERIAMLKRPSPRRWQTGLSSALLLALFAVSGYAAWAQQPGAPAVTTKETLYGVRFQLDLDGAENPFEVHTYPGEPFGFMVAAKQGHTWSGEFTLTPAGEGRVALEGHLRDNDRLVSSPKLQFNLDSDAAIEVDDGDAGSTLRMQVAARVLAKQEMPRPAPDDADSTTSVLKGDVRIDTAKDGTPSVSANAIETTREASQKPFSTLKPPSYPEEAANARVEGRVVLLVDVAPDGSVAAATIETSRPAGVFDAAVLKAVRGWTFNPAMNNGAAVAGRVRVPVDFALDDTPAGGTQAALNRGDYGWFTEEHGKQVASGLKCDVALLEQHDNTGEIRRRCGISRPATAVRPDAAPQPGVQPGTARAGLMADR